MSVADPDATWQAGIQPHSARMIPVMAVGMALSLFRWFPI
jgi:hypothetical protein